MITNAQVQAKAREFLNTPFKNQQRVKGKRGGIDCVGLVLLVAEELGIAYKDTAEMRGNDYLNYHYAGLNSFVLTECKKRLIEKPVKDMKPGDVFVMAVPDIPCHCGIVTEQRGKTYMIHALNTGDDKGKVVEHIMSAEWRAKIRGVFSYPGVKD